MSENTPSLLSQKANKLVLTNSAKREKQKVQTITLVLQLMKPTKAKLEMYHLMTNRNTAFANWLLDYEELPKATSKTYKTFSSEKQERLPSAIACETVRAVQSQKEKQNAKQFRRFWCGFNNQNLDIKVENGLYKASFPTLEQRVGVPLVVFDNQQKWLNLLLSGEVKQGTAKLINRRGLWFICIPLSFEIKKKNHRTQIMGVDLGLRNIAVATVGTKSLFFSGDEIAFRRRRFAARRRSLGKSKKHHAIRNSKGKESRWMKAENHRISRKIVDWAIQESISIIRLEDLTDIRHDLRSKKEAGRSLHKWSHYQLSEFIRYKAYLAGIKVEFVRRHYTSLSCKCGYRDKRNRNRCQFKCVKCGYRQHADVNGAINIAKAISGLAD